MDRLELKASFSVDEAGTISGLASVFGSADLGGDIVHRGAFAGAVPPIPMLASHDQADVVGVWEELTETAQGLAVKGRLLVADVARAAEVRALILAGAMSGLSIGYLATKKAARTGGGRDLFRVALKEISIVAVPMHPGAKITAVKALEGGKVDSVTLEELQAKLGEVETKHAGEMTAAIAAAVAPLAEKLAKFEAKANRPGGGEPSQELTLERKAFQAYLARGPLAGDVELKALSLSNDALGGYLAPPEYSAEIQKDIIEMSNVRSLASVRGTNAPSVIYPTRGPMGNAVWDDEQDAETETTSNGIFGVTEVVTKGMSTFVDISNMLLQDAPQAEAEVRAALTEDFEKKESVAFVKGNGTSQPQGFMTHPDVAVALNGHATDLKPDALISMLYSVPQTYRNGGVWVMNGKTLGMLRTLKDGDGTFLWQKSFQAGQPETVLGRPVLEMLDMDDVAAGTFPIAYADFSGFRILDRLALSMLVDPYSQASRKITRIHAGRRVGGRVLMAAKFRKFKMAVA